MIELLFLLGEPIEAMTRLDLHIRSGNKKAMLAKEEYAKLAEKNRQKRE